MNFWSKPNQQRKNFQKVFCRAVIGCGILFLLESFTPYFLNSYPSRLGENDLPKAIVEGKGEIYVRMKADDFRFPLPPRSLALAPLISAGGFDWVDGTVEVRFDASTYYSPIEYEYWLRNKLKAGAAITATQIAGGLLIKFHYFGDK